MRIVTLRIVTWIQPYIFFLLYVCDNAKWTRIHMLQCVGSQRISAFIWAR